MDVDVTFNCNGKVNINDWRLPANSLFLRGEVDSIIFPQTNYEFSHTTVKIFDNEIPASIAIFDLKHFVKCMDMKLKILCRHENYSNTLISNKEDVIDYFAERKAICDLLLYIRNYMTSIKWEYELLKPINNEIDDDVDLLFTTIKRFTGRLKKIPDSMLHYVASTIGNKCTQPEFHLYHMHIELRWLFITLVYLRDHFSQCSIENHLEILESTLYTIINDLVYISSKLFERIPLMDLRQKTPYSCTCCRELWLMIQILIEDLVEKRQSKLFWEHLNVSINTLLNKEESNRERPVEEDDSNRNDPTCKNPELFSVWMIYHLSLLHGYNVDGVYLELNSARIKPNYEQVETVLKSYISKGGKEGERDKIDEELKIMIPILQHLITGWWPPRVQFVSLLWDCFHKRLDQPFLLQTHGPWTISLEKKSPNDILKELQKRIDNSSEETKESSYSLFLRLLGIFLKQNDYRNDTKHWNHIKGRIYTKFSKAKVHDFSTAGLYNFLSLFLTLGITADTVTVCSVMFDLLPLAYEYNKQNSKTYILSWKGKLAVLILYSERKLSFTPLAATVINEVEKLSCRNDEVSRSMMTTFVDVLMNILSSTGKLRYGEHMFIGNWLDRYILDCPRSKIGELMEKFSNVVEKCTLDAEDNSEDDTHKMLEAMWSNVACIVRQLIHDPPLAGNQYQNVAQLANAFTVEALRNPAMAERYKHTPLKLFRHFAIPLIIKDIRITRYYLKLILQRQDVVMCLKNADVEFNTILIQAWVKCSILTRDINRSEAKILQDYITDVYEIKNILSENNDLHEFQNSDKSIISFIITSMKKRNTLQTEYEINQYDAKYRSYFKHIEKWIVSPITDETKESELAFWIYECIGTLILCCAPMLYVKNQPNNMLRMIINKIALPLEQSAQSYIRSLGKRIFSMILLGMENLNAEFDLVVQSIMKDLFIQYIPLLVTEDTAGNFKIADGLITCFQRAKPTFSTLMLKIIAVNFFHLNGNVINKHCYLVMMLLKHLAKAGKMFSIHIIKQLITTCIHHVIECFIKVHQHHPHKQQTVELVKEIVKNPYFLETKTLRDDFKSIILKIVQQNLIRTSQATFELLHSLCSISTDIVQNMHPIVENIVNNSERYGPSTAASLRYSWKQYQSHWQNTQRSVGRD